MKIHTRVLLTALVLTTAACNVGNNGDRVVGELASDRVEITAESNEPIIDVLVAEGEKVSRGQLLIRQNPDRAAARLAEAEAVLNQAQARLDELVRGPRSEQIKAARASENGAVRELDFRQAEYERIQRIYERDLASPDLLDRAKAEFDAAQASLSLRRAQLEELLAGTRVEELAQAEQAVKQARARHDNAKIDLERHDITSPSDGIVDSRLFEKGERPTPGQPVLVLLPGDQAHARVYVPEHSRVLVGPGTEARIYVDGLDEPIAGRTRWVASESAFTPYYALTERDRGRLSFAAKIDIVEERDRLPDGVPVEVEFLIRNDE